MVCVCVYARFFLIRRGVYVSFAFYVNVHATIPTFYNNTILKILFSFSTLNSPRLICIPKFPKFLSSNYNLHLKFLGCYNCTLKIKMGQM